MFYLLRHYWRKRFRGPLIEMRPHEHAGTVGELRQYRSGYIEYAPEGAHSTPVDVALDLYYQTQLPRTWRCMKTQGGGKFDLINVTRDEAVRQVMEVGHVVHVDDGPGFIFYREKA